MKRLQALLTAPVIGIFGVALIVRVLYNIIGAHDYYPLHDSLTYQTIAFNILDEHCYCLLPHLPTVDRAPLWPAIIAAIYGILGPHDRTVRLFLCIVGSATCVLIYFFARDLFSKRIGILAGLFAAIYPFLFIYDAWLYSESLYIFLLLAFCYTLYRLQRSPHWSLMLLSGVLLSLLSLTRPNGPAILALFLVWAFVMGRTKQIPRHAVIRSAIIVTIVFFAFIAPWTIRNYEVTHAFVPTAVGDGKVLLGAYNDKIIDPHYFNGYYLGVWVIPNQSTPQIADRFPADCAGSCEVTRDNTYKADAVQWMETHISKMPYLLGLHFINMWQTNTQEADLAINRFPDRPVSRLVVEMMQVMTPVLFALAALGLVVTLRRRWRELLFFYMIIALTIVQCIILYGIPRFRAPIEPMLIILGAGAVWWLATRRKKHGPSQQRKPDVNAEAVTPGVEKAVK
jgi:4-amino-4-deoxy-L-arabinose transferase-like glycosyltransferase